jgi:hypothetical protein
MGKLKREPTICDTVAYYTMKLTNEPEHSCSEKDGCQCKSCGSPVIDFVLHQGSKVSFRDKTKQKHIKEEHPCKF